MPVQSSTSVNPAELAPYQTFSNRAKDTGRAIFTEFGFMLVEPGSVLALLLITLGGSNFLVGLVGMITASGALLPQLMISGMVQRQPYKKPILVGALALRSVIYLVMGIVVLLIPGGGISVDTALFLLIFLFVLSRLSLSVVDLTYLEVISKVVPPRKLMGHFALAQFGAGIAALLAGLIVNRLLSHPESLVNHALYASTLFQPVYSVTPYGWLYLLSTALLVVGWGIYALLKEPPSLPRAASSPIGQLKRGWVLLKDNAPFRRYILVYLGLVLSGVVAPFYAVFLVTDRGVSASLVGIYIAVQQVSRILSNVLWGRWPASAGVINQLAVAIGLASVPPVVALAISLTTLPGDITGLVALLLYISAGISGGGVTIGVQATLIQFTPSEERTTYIGLVSTMSGLIFLLTSVSGLVVDALGYRSIFIFGVVILFATIYLTLTLSGMDVSQE